MAGHTVNPGYTEKKRSAAGMGQARTQQGHPGMKHAHTAFTEDRTRVFKTPKMEGGGGAAVKTKPRSFFADLLESLDETWLRDVDLVKKQAILHKKFVEHRRGLALAVVICIIFGLFCGGIYELLFQVRSVDIQGSSLYDSRQVLAVSGLEMENMRMYDFRKQEVVDQITLHCPFIRSVTLERNLPDTVSLILEDDRIQYCANVFGEIVALSDSLRVLGTLGAAEAEQYVLLRLPEVTHAVAGRTLVFAEERDERYIRLVLSEMTGSRLADRISYIDLRDEHDVVMYCDGMYSLEFGNTADMKLKLRRAQTVIDDPDFPQNTPARVNLRVVSEASVRADLRLDLQVEP